MCSSILQELYAELQVMSVTSQSTAMARRPFAGLIFSFRMVIPVQTLQHTAMKVYVRPTTTNVRFSLALVSVIVFITEETETAFYSNPKFIHVLCVKYIEIHDESIFEFLSLLGEIPPSDAVDINI